MRRGNMPTKEQALESKRILEELDEVLVEARRQGREEWVSRILAQKRDLEDGMDAVFPQWRLLTGIAPTQVN